MTNKNTQDLLTAQTDHVDPTLLAYQRKQTITSAAFKELENIVTTQFTWENLPDDVPIDYIERSLFYNQSVLAFKDPVMGLMFGTGTASGINHYGMPTTYELVSPSLQTLNMKTKYEIGKDSVMLRGEDSMFAQTSSTTMAFNPANLSGMGNYMTNYQIVMLYASLMERGRSIQQSNLDGLAQPYVVAVDGGNETRAKLIMNKILNNEPIIFDTEEAQGQTVQDMISIMSLDPKYYVNDLEDYYKNMRNSALTFFGIDNFDTDKKERSLTGEINANNMQIALAFANRLRYREEFADKVNKMFGTDIKVYATIDKGDSDEQVYDNISRTVPRRDDSEERDI